MPKVSVIIPVYNVEKYLGECLDSVLGQTLKDIEVICVDDGSTDGSAGILAEYAQKDSRIKIVTQPNGGLSAARNAGMDVATGKYIYFLDSDDWIVDDAMARCVEICDSDNIEQLIFGCNLKSEEGGLKADENLRGKKRYLQVPPELLGKVMSGAEFLLRTAGIFRGYYAAVCFRFMKRSVLTDATLRFYSGMIHEDECFTPLALAIARRVEIIGDRLYWYRLRDGSIMTNEGDSGRERHLAHTMMAALRIRTGAEKMRLSGLQRKASDCAWRRLKDKCVRRAIRNFPAFRRACRVADELASPQERPALASLRRTILMGWIMGRFRRAASGRFARLFPCRGGKGADKR